MMRWLPTLATILLVFIFSCAHHVQANLPKTSALLEASTLLKIDRIVIYKSKRQLILYSGQRVIEQYRVALGPSPTGHKWREGDGKTPEGRYAISEKKPDSAFHLALKISYPNEEDTKRAREFGVSPGGNIMIHGLKNGYGWLGGYHARKDWTHGCVALTNKEIEYIYSSVDVGTVVDIYP